MMFHRALALLVGVSLLAFAPMVRAQERATPAAESGLTVVASGLTSPRGFAWRDDGTLYLADAGWGGDNHMPIMEGFTLDSGLTSSIVTIANSCVTPLVRGLVSSRWEEPGDWTWGAMDVAFLDGDLYVLLSGAGPTWFSPAARSGVYRVSEDGTMTLVADITTWLPEHPPKLIPPDYNTDGSLFDLEATSDALLLSEAVGGQIIKVTPGGEISTFVDLSEQHPVPTGIAVDADDNVYVSFETAVPYVDGSTKVVKVAPDGTVSDAWTGLTRVADLVLGPDGALYAAELSTENTDVAPYVHSDSGRIVRQTGPDSMEVIVEGVDFPTGLGFGPDGALYVSGPANGAGMGEGWLARVEMGGTAVSGAPVSAATTGSCAAEGTPVS